MALHVLLKHAVRDCSFILTQTESETFCTRLINLWLRKEFMSYFIIIRGPLGSGKTLIARRLAGVLDAEYVSIDSLLKKNGLDKITGRCIPLKNFIKADELILANVKSILKQGRIVVFDGNFYHKGHIEHILQRLGKPYFVFTLFCHLETCIIRDRTRKKSYGEGATSAVYFLVSKVKYGIPVDAEKNPDSVLKKILVYLTVVNASKN